MRPISQNNCSVHFQGLVSEMIKQRSELELIQQTQAGGVLSKTFSQIRLHWTGFLRLSQLHFHLHQRQGQIRERTGQRESGGAVRHRLKWEFGLGKGNSSTLSLLVVSLNRELRPDSITDVSGYGSHQITLRFNMRCQGHYAKMARADAYKRSDVNWPVSKMKASLFKCLAILRLNSKINRDKYPYSESVMTLIKNIFTQPCLQFTSETTEHRLWI